MIEIRLEHELSKAVLGDNRAAYNNALTQVRQVASMRRSFEERVRSRLTSDDDPANDDSASEAILGSGGDPSQVVLTASEQLDRKKLATEIFYLSAKLLASGLVYHESRRSNLGPSGTLFSVRSGQLRNIAPWLPALLPWPPPSASAQQVIGRELLAPAGARTLYFGDIDARLRSTLAAAGYDDLAYYGVPGGFAIVTRVEQINAGGLPLSASARWSSRVVRPAQFSLEGLLRAFFAADPGRFRILVFILTPEPFATSPARARLSVMSDWSTGGFSRLPPRMKTQEFTRDHEVTALIYEFEKAPGAREASLLIPGSLTGRDHLRGTGILSQLGRVR